MEANGPFMSEAATPGRKLPSSGCGSEKGRWLNRCPFLAWDVQELPRGSRITEPRVLLAATLCTPWGPLQVGPTHTSGIAIQHRTIATHLRSQFRALSLLLMGDFNAVEDSEAMTTLTREAGFSDAFRVVHPTTAGYTSDQSLATPTSTVTQRIDSVLVVAPARDYVPDCPAGCRVLRATGPLSLDGRTHRSLAQSVSPLAHSVCEQRADIHLEGRSLGAGFSFLVSGFRTWDLKLGT